MTDTITRSATIQDSISQVLSIDGALQELSAQVQDLLRQREALTGAICYLAETTHPELLGAYSMISQSIAVHIPRNWHQVNPEQRVQFIKINPGILNL